MAAESRDRWHHFFFFSVEHFIPRWPSKMFILIGCGVLHMQLWRHNEGPYDVIKITSIPHKESICAKFQFFPLCGFRGTEVQSYSVFFNMAATPRDLWRHVGKTEKLWTSVSLKPHQGKNWNLAHSKYSSWGLCDFYDFIVALVMTS